MEKWKKYKGVIFTGKQDNPYKYIIQADYLVQLSEFESQCISMHEALILGTPVIVTDFKTAIKVVNKDNGIILKKDMSNFYLDEILNKKYNFKFEYPDYFKEWKKVLKPAEKRNYKFTVLIPNFNNSKYLEKCIKSVINQTYKNYEIIFIDDMSTDNSVYIARKLLKNINSTIIQNRQKRYNGGTRNVGILEAVSDYTICIDSDDWLKDNKVIERINNALIRNEDILFLEYNMYKDGQEIFLKEIEPYETKIKALKSETCAIWTKVVKTELLKETLFDEGNLMEDKIHHMRLCYKMKTYKTLRGVTHIWNRSNSTSVSTDRKHKWNNSAYRHIAEYLDFMNEVQEDELKEYIKEKVALMKSEIKKGVYKQW